MNPFEYIVVSITTNCNMTCKGCFKIHSTVSDLLPHKFFRIIDFSKRIGCKYINLSGGEPLLNPYWEDLIELCSKNNITPILSTNGLLLPNLNHDALQKLGVLAIPLDGPNPEINDSIRCEGHFNKIFDLVNDYKSGNYPFTLKINTLVTKKNIHNIDHIAALLLNDSRIIWKLFQASSRGTYNTNYDLDVSNDEFLSTVNKFMNIDDRKCKILYLCADSAIEYLIMSPDGNIYLPEVDRYRRIGSISDPRIIELTKNANSNGNSFSKLVLGDD